MLEYWMSINESAVNASEAGIEKVLQNPESAVLFIDYPPWLLRFAAICCSLFMVIGTMGNLFTIIGLSRSEKLKNATAVFIMNLSVSDLLFCCFNLPLAISTFWHRSWLHGATLCRLFPLLRYGLVAVSIFTVLAITVNRYVLIGHPRIYPKLYKRKYLIAMLLTIWIFSFGILLLTWFGKWGRFGLDLAVGSCSILPDVNGRSPKEFLFILACLAPCVAIVICYARIFYIVRKTAAKSRLRNQTDVSDAAESSCERSGCSKNEEREEFSSSSSYCINCTTLSCNDLLRKQTSACKKPVDPKEEAELATINVDVSENEKSTLAKIIENIPFADDPDEIGHEEERATFFENDRRKTEDLKDKSLTKAKRKLERMSTQTSIVLEPILWLQKITAKENRLELPKTPTRSRSSTPEQEKLSTGFRRDSKFRSFGRFRNKYTVGRMSAKDKKLLRMILVIFVSFLVCYLPITVTKLFKGSIDWRGLNIAGYILIYLTTCINPVVYVVMSAEYRSAYKNVLLCSADAGTFKHRI